MHFLRGNRIADLNEKLGMSVLFITHDLGTMAQLRHSVRGMYLGNLVEEAETEELFDNPLHPYTKTLFASTPDITRRERKVSLAGEIPRHTEELQGCVFHTRRPYATDHCRQCALEMRKVFPAIDLPAIWCRNRKDAPPAFEVTPKS